MPPSGRDSGKDLTAGLELQSEIARALDNNNYTLMASLDLTSAFDIVNLYD